MRLLIESHRMCLEAETTLLLMLSATVRKRKKNMPVEFRQHGPAREFLEPVLA